MEPSSAPVLPTEDSSNGSEPITAAVTVKEEDVVETEIVKSVENESPSTEAVLDSSECDPGPLKAEIYSNLAVEYSLVPESISNNDQFGDTEAVQKLEITDESAEVDAAFIERQNYIKTNLITEFRFVFPTFDVAELKKKLGKKSTLEQQASGKETRSTRRRKLPAEHKSHPPKKPKKEKPKKCTVCTLPIVSTELPERRIYCSTNCIVKMVKRCEPCCKPNEQIQFMDAEGTFIQIPNSQTVYIHNLQEFLTLHPYVKPFVDFNKLDAGNAEDNNAKLFDADKNLKKEDAVRTAVKKNIHDQLMARAKRSKIGVSRKATMELSEQIELALYRMHKSVKSAKYRGWCQDFLQEIMNDKNLFFKNVVTNMYSAQKLVTMAKADMFLDPEAPQNGSLPTLKKTPQLLKKTTLKSHTISAVDSILGEEGADTTLKHNSHEYDSNCQICLQKTAKRRAMLEMLDKDREEEIEDRKRRKEMGKARGKQQSEGQRRSTSRSHVEDDFYVDDIDMSYSDRSPRDESQDCALPKHNSPERILTPPPGVSPDRIAIRRISPDMHHSYLRSPASSSSSAKMDHNRARSPQLGPRYPFVRPRFPHNDFEVEPSVYPTMRPRFAQAAMAFPSHRSMLTPDRLSPNSFLGHVPRWGGPGPLRPMFPPRMERGPRPLANWRKQEQWQNPDESMYVEYPEPSPSVIQLSPVEQPQNVHQTSLKHETASPIPPEHADVEAPESPKEAANPWETEDLVIWSGRMEEDGTDFRCSLQAVSNVAAFTLRDLLPDPFIIKARVRPVPMWEFIKTVRSSRRYQIILAAVLAEGTGVDVDRYYKCCNDLKKSNRCGVMELPVSLGIKEAYLFQLDPCEPLPAMFDPIDGPGIPEGRQTKGLLCMVIVKYAGVHKSRKNEVPTSVSEQSAKSTPKAIETQEEDGMPKTLEEMLALIENAKHPSVFFKVVPVFIKRNADNPNIKEVLRVACNAKIEKHRRLDHERLTATIPAEDAAFEQSASAVALDGSMEVPEASANFHDEPAEATNPMTNGVGSEHAEQPSNDSRTESEIGMMIDESSPNSEIILKPPPAPILVAPPVAPKINLATLEPGEMVDDDMDISDDDSASSKKAPNAADADPNFLLPPPPPPPSSEALMTPSKPQVTSQHNQPEEKEFPSSFLSPQTHPARMPLNQMFPHASGRPPPPPRAPGLFFNSEPCVRPMMRHESPRSFLDVEEGEITAPSPPPFMSTERSRGKRARGVRGARGGLPSHVPTVDHGENWIRPCLPSQEEMFMAHGVTPSGQPPFRHMVPRFSPRGSPMALNALPRPPPPRMFSPPPPRGFRPPFHGPPRFY